MTLRSEAHRPWMIFGYPLSQFPFPGMVADSLSVPDLTELRAEDLPLRTWQTDQQSPWHADFYAGFAKWEHYFRWFVHAVIAPLVAEPFYYQRVPTFRVHLPGNLAVGEYHRDAQYHHPAGEINFWVPLTYAADTASVWIENDDGVMTAPDVAPGSMIRFDAVNRLHGNKINDTGRSRVSFDFRALPTRLLPTDPGLTEHTKLTFAPGGYYAHEKVWPGDPAAPRVSER